MSKNHIFSILPESFFSVLASSQQEIYADCLFLLYHHFQQGKSFGGNKDVIIELLTNYFISQKLEEPKAKMKAILVLNRLKQCGWLFEEETHNYEISINFTYYAIPIIKTLNELKRKEELEYMGYIFAIYSMVKNIDTDSLNNILEQIVSNMMIVMDKLKTLNANIINYLQALFKHKDEKDLKSIVDSLFIDYKQNVVDDYYQRLKTADNLSKYRPFIISKLNEISLNQDIIRQSAEELVQKRKFTDLTLAQEHIEKQIDYIISSFTNMQEIINEIDIKNSQYIKTAVKKILFIVNQKDDCATKIKYIINYLVKNRKQKKVIEELYSLFNVKFINYKSLYTLPERNNRTNEQVIETEKTLSHEEKQTYLNKVLESSHFNKKQIINYVLENLNEKLEIKASLLPINNIQDYLKIIFIYLYSNRDVPYKIEKLNTFYQEKGFYFPDFVIRRI